MVEAYLAAVAEPVTHVPADTPILRSVRGVLKNADVKAYRRHLTQKSNETAACGYERRADVLLDRRPHADTSVAIWTCIETGLWEGFLAAHAITTVHGLVQRELGAANAKQLMALMLRVFHVATVDGAVIEQALRLPMADFEDAVTAAAAVTSECQYVVTRDPKGFRGSPIQALAPEATLPILGLQ